MANTFDEASFLEKVGAVLLVVASLTAPLWASALDKGHAGFADYGDRWYDKYNIPRY